MYIFIRISGNFLLFFHSLNIVWCIWIRCQRCQLSVLWENSLISIWQMYLATNRRVLIGHVLLSWSDVTVLTIWTFTYYYLLLFQNAATMSLYQLGTMATTAGTTSGLLHNLLPGNFPASCVKRVTNCTAACPYWHYIVLLQALIDITW